MTTSAVVDYLRTAAEYGPRNTPTAPNLLGWWTADYWYVCARCAGRVIGRGCQLPEGCTPVWRDEPYGVCCVCE